MLSLHLQLCVQKLRILIEDSDQNCKSLPSLCRAVCVPSGRCEAILSLWLPGGCPSWHRNSAHAFSS